MLKLVLKVKKSVSSKLDEARQKLPHKVFFRTVPNNRQLKILAKYIKEKMKLDTAVVFYEKASEFYSKSGKEIFIKEYEKLGEKKDGEVKLLIALLEPTMRHKL